MTVNETLLIEAALILAEAEDRLNGKEGAPPPGLILWRDLDLWTEAMENFMARVRAYKDQPVLTKS